MKKVVLVTWLGRRNYGTCLQSYALHKKLELLGYHVSFLSLLPKRYTLKFIIGNYLSKIGILDKLLKHSNPPENLQEVKRRAFQKKNINIIRILSKREERRLVADTDCFITGSDQIWNTYRRYNPFYFLSFAEGRKRIAYSSSIGTNSIKEEYKECVKQYLMKFSHIGVREFEAVKVLSELTGRKDIRQVLDPTFLLTPHDWKFMVKDAVYEEELPTEYIFCYLLGNNQHYKEQLLDVKHKSGISHILIIPSAENKTFSCEGTIIYKNASPIEFIDLLQRASCVCTDSFHATALSINHSIQFVEFIRFCDADPESQNSRIYDLLNHFGLLDRIYNSDSFEWLEKIDYNPIQKILEKDRRESLNYLVNAIEK